MNRQGRNERIYYRREIIDENGAIIPSMSVGAAPTLHSFSTSSLVSSRRVGEISSITNTDLRVMNNNVSLPESYGFVVPYMYDAQTYRRRRIDLTNNNLYSRNVRNNNADMNMNLSSTMNAREYSTGFVVDQDVHVHLPLKRTSTMREFGEGSSTSVQARPTLGEPFLVQMDCPYHSHIGESFSLQPTTTQHVQGFNSIYSRNPFAPNMINHYHFQRENNMSPLLGRGIPYLETLPIHPQQNVFTFGNIDQPNAIEWGPQINLHQQDQYHHHGIQTIMSPHVPSTTSSILENLHRSITTSNMVQVGGNAEQQPLLQQTLDPELMRQMAIEWAPQVNLHQQEHHPSTQTTLSPHVPFTTSSIIENLQRSMVPSDMIQVGGNVEQQPLFHQTLDPQLMREVTQTQEDATILDTEVLFQIFEDMFRQWRQSQNEQGLTEDEINNNIIQEKFDVTIEGDLENKEACCICRDRFINGEDIGKLDCGHIFHIDCIKLWLERKNLCPLCKRRGLVF